MVEIVAPRKLVLDRGFALAVSVSVPVALFVALLVTPLAGCSVDTSGFGLGFGVRPGDAGAHDGPAADRPGPVVDTGSPDGGSGGMPATSSGGQMGTSSGGTSSGGMTGTGGAAGRPGSGGSAGSAGSGEDRGGNGGLGGRANPGSGGVGTGGAPGSGGAAGSAAGGSSGCGPATCPTGCCNANDVCVTGNRAKRCGLGGAACVACDSCFQCVAGACQVDPASTWTVTCASAVIAPTRGGALWDPVGLGLPAVIRDLLPGDGVRPDPFCELRLQGEAQTSTSVLRDTLNPAWDEAITSSDNPLTASDLMSPATGWTVFVGDDDGSPRAFDDICEISPQPTAADFGAGTLTFADQQNCTHLTLALTCTN